MKRLLTLLLLIISINVFGQKQPQPSGTLTPLSTNQAYFRASDSTYYFYNGVNYLWNYFLNKQQADKLYQPIGSPSPLAYSLSTGYGLSGSSFNGSVARTFTADTASASGLVSKSRLATNLGGYVPNTRTITINGATRDLSANRTWNVGTVTSVTPAYGLTPQTAITSSGTFRVDTAAIQTVLNFFPKGDTRYAKIGDIPTQYWSRSGTTLSPATANDSLNIGSGIYKGHGAKSDASDGFLIEASNGTDVGRFGVANTANSSLFGALNVSGNSTGNKLYSTNPTEGTAGTDSLVVHINSTNELARISPAYYSRLSDFGTSAISLGGTANGLSYLSGNYRLHKATATTGGVLTADADTISGIKTWNTASGYAGYFNKTISTGGILGFQVLGVDKSFLEWEVNDGGSSVGTAMNLRNNQGAVGLYDNTNTGLKISGGNGTLAGTLTLADEAYSSSWNGKLEAPTKNAIWDAGFLTSLSGAVLTTTDQSIAGVKTYTNSISLTGGGFIVNGDSGGTTLSAMDLRNTGGTTRFGTVGSTVDGIFTGSSAYATVFGSSTNTPIEFGLNGNIKAVISTSGSISSTPQGTLYGTASGSITSAQLATSLTDETGTGSVVFSASPTFTGTVTTATLNANGATTIDAGNGNQLTLDNAGERFTQITVAHNGTQKASQFWDNTNSFYQLGTDVASSTVRVVAQTNGVELANGATSWSAISDLRQKEIIRPIDSALVAMQDFRTVIGRYKTDNKETERSFLIAQDVQKTYPYAVTVGNDEDKTLRLSYTELIPLLVKAIQELEAKIKVLENK